MSSISSPRAQCPALDSDESSVACLENLRTERAGGGGVP